MGSTVDAMSDAVDNAEVMLSCISLQYKESASEIDAQWSRACPYIHIYDIVCTYHMPCADAVACVQTAGWRHSTVINRTWT
jgi:hypothetical protein